MGDNATADAKPASDAKPGPDENPAAAAADTVPENDASGAKEGDYLTPYCVSYDCKDVKCTKEGLAAAKKIRCSGTYCGVRDGNTDSPTYGCDDTNGNSQALCKFQLDSSTPNPCQYQTLPPYVPVVEGGGKGGKNPDGGEKPGGGSGPLAGGWKLTLGGAVLVSLVGFFYGL